MARKEYSFYSGCPSERNASASNYMVSVESMCKTLDIKLNEIPDWNCCGACIGYAEGGELPRHAMNAPQHRAFRPAQPEPGHRRDLRRLLARRQESQERIAHSGELLADIKNISSRTPASTTRASGRSATWSRC